MTNNIQAGTTIGNIAVLDLRSATEESVSRIRAVGNAAVILTSPETASLPPLIQFGNVANTVEVKGDPLLISGNETLTRDSFKNIPTPLDILVAGNVTLAADIQPEELDAGLENVVIAGNVVCPDHLVGIIHAKAKQVGGNLMVYPGDAKLIQGSVALTTSHLQSLEDGTKLAILGAVKATEVLSNDLIAQKLSSLHISGRLICHEENASTLMAGLDSTSAKVTIIPAGYHYVEKDLTLTNAMLSALPSKKLYCQSIRIDEDVDASTLDAQLDSLIVKNMLVCPASLQSNVAQKCDLLATEAIFYSGELWLFEDSSTLLAQRFDYLDDKATMIVTGELTLAEEVDPAVLATRLEKVHNLGMINCSTGQLAALQSRLGVNRGLLEDISSDSEEEEGRGRAIGNIAYLKL